MHYLILFVTGIVVGTMNAIAGGGMLIGFPVLLACGIPPLVANASSNIIVLPGQITSAFGYRRYLKKVPRKYWLLVIPCAIGGAIGALILRNTSSDGFEKIVPWLILFAVVLFIFQPLIQIQLRHHMKRRSTARKPPMWLFPALIPLAVYGGYFGAGLGFVLLAFLSFTDLHDTHKMNALKNVAAAVICVVSIICLYSTHLIDWKHGGTMAAGNMLGGYFGAVYAQKISSHSIRIAVIAIGVVTAGLLFFNTYS
jgi:uncharacterized membrane protein YfcA